MKYIALLVLLTLAHMVVEVAHAETGEPSAPAKYLGVVTCAGSNCHGASQPVKDSRVLQNEFITWHRADKHANAYRSLLSEKGQAIARKLGLDAATAPECLNCHANNVAEDLRGKRFQLADGVSCETCHGAASNWLGLHVTGEATRDDNIKAGMNRIDDPPIRADLCLSCHLGSESKFATHRIMGAGHPRLSFELDTFTLLQPAHFQVDTDYRERKQVTSHAQIWAIGQASAALRTLELYLSNQWRGGVLPEFAFFDCHACHHPMTTPRWAPRATTGLPPGLVRFNDAHFMMLLYLTQAIDPALAESLRHDLLALHQATTESVEATRAAAKTLQANTEQIRRKVSGHAFDANATRQVLDSIVNGGINGDYRDFAAAEQAVMAIHALTDSLEIAQALDPAKASEFDQQIKTLYGLLENENTFDANRFSTELGTLKTALR